MKIISQQHGFTLIESMIAIFLLVITIFVIASVTTSVIKGNTYNWNSTTATTLAMDKMEEIKNTAYDSLSSGSDTADIFTRTWAIVSGTDSKTINVTVTWSWQGSSHSVELKTIRAKD